MNAPLRGRALLDLLVPAYTVQERHREAARAEYRAARVKRPSSGSVLLRATQLARQEHEAAQAARPAERE